MSDGGPARPLLITAHAVGAVGAGMLVAWGLALSPVFGMTQFEPVVLVPSVIAVVAALVALAPRVIRFAPGWMVAALGAVLALAVYQLQVSMLQPAIAATVGIAVGLVLGGALLALGGEAGAARLVIAAGLAAGVLLRPTAVYMIMREFAPPGPGISSDTLLTYGIASVLIVVAVLHGVAARMGAPRSTVTPSAPRGALETAAVIAVVAVAAVVLDSAVSGVIDRSPTYAKLDLPIGATVAAVNLVASAALAVVVGFALAWLAYRRSGLDAARWVIAGCAVALPLAYLPDSSVFSPAAVSAAVLFGVGAGVAGARLADRAGPWDMLGALVSAGGLLMANPRFGLGDTISSGTAYLVMIVGLGLTLGAGLTLLARRTAGCDGPSFVARAVPGFAAIVLVGQVLVPISVRSYASGVLTLGLPMVVIMFGLVLLVLFGLGRSRESSVG
jgi:hypothetical protein